VLADKGYTGAGDHVRVPYRDRGKPASQKDANRARPAALTRRASQRPAQDLADPAQLRCCPWRAGQLAKAIHVLQAREVGGLRSLARLPGGERIAREARYAGRAVNEPDRPPKL
jgi:hypothetical protein